MDQKAKTGSEFSNLANSRSVPETKTATGQNLTRELKGGKTETAGADGLGTRLSFFLLPAAQRKWQDLCPQRPIN